MAQASGGTPLGKLSCLPAEIRLQIYRHVLLPAEEVVNNIRCRTFFGFSESLMLSKTIYEEAQSEYNLHRFRLPDLVDYDIRQAQSGTTLRAAQQDKLTHAMDTAASASDSVSHTSHMGLVIRLRTRSATNLEPEDIDTEAFRFLLALLMEHICRLMLSDRHCLPPSPMKEIPSWMFIRSERLFKSGHRYREVAIVLESSFDVVPCDLSAYFDWCLGIACRAAWNPAEAQAWKEAGLGVACHPQRQSLAIRRKAPAELVVHSDTACRCQGRMTQFTRAFAKSIALVMMGVDRRRRWLQALAAREASITSAITNLSSAAIAMS